MMKKILITYLFFMLLGIDDIWAKEIIIDNIKYDDGSNIVGNGYSFESNEKLLFLDGYNGGIIIYDDFLKIRIRNCNTINDNEKINENDDIVIDDNKNIITNDEYEEDNSKVEIINPKTIDSININIIVFFLSIFMIIITFSIRRVNG